MAQTFKFAYAFSQQLSWDTSRVTAMRNTFDYATAFSEPLPWDTSKVATMDGTFKNAEAFNALLDWDTSKVVSTDDFAYMVTARASRLPAARTHPCTSASAHRRAPAPPRHAQPPLSDRVCPDPPTRSSHARARRATP